MNVIRHFVAMLILGTTAFSPAHEKIPSPVKDDNNVIDNTLDSLNKARTADLSPDQRAKATIRYCFSSATPRCVQAHSATAPTDNGVGDIFCPNISIRIR